ncbi:hypothetical protein B0H34DRAFT_732928 [Crassisporium funariophilum]|nr:hypothetical protein B0H34DRAFT_732928 [Crassisporium funariophilum]
MKGLSCTFKMASGPIDNTTKLNIVEFLFSLLFVVGVNLLALTMGTFTGAQVLGELQNSIGLETSWKQSRTMFAADWIATNDPCRCNVFPCRLLVMFWKIPGVRSEPWPGLCKQHIPEHSMPLVNEVRILELCTLPRVASKLHSLLTCEGTISDLASGISFASPNSSTIKVTEW